MNFKIKFKGFPTLEAQLDDNIDAEQYYELMKKTYKEETPVFRDFAEYNDTEYWKSICIRLTEAFGWDIDPDDLSIENTTYIHKFVENALSPTESFSDFPAEHDQLVHDAHMSLHAIEQYLIDKKRHGNYLQVEWFNDVYIPLSDNFNHSLHIEYGDLRLQNPHVGHVPSFVYYQNDTRNINRTCQFHDKIKPAVHINLHDNKFDFNITKYINWWKTEAPEFVGKHGIEKILHFTGDPVIGRILNTDVLREMEACPDVLEFESIDCA